MHQVFFAPPPPPPLPAPQVIVHEPDAPPPLQGVLVGDPRQELQILEIPLPAEEVRGEQGINIANAGVMRGAFQNRGLRRSKCIEFHF